MNLLQIEPTDFTPKIYLNPDSEVFEIAGFSRPEDVLGFYSPILKWMEDFSSELFEAKKNKSQFTQPLRFIFRLTYFNSSSAKLLLQFLELVKKLDSNNIPVNIEWYYDEGDDQILEDGEDLASALEMKFQFIELKS